ncbi:MAG: protein kinase, partial [Candidatus Acidiferrales bacterium]
MANSPTLTHMATMQGVLLGTAAYMSPEQAKAKPVDRRADIWAFGCVLYEMLTGKMAFTGETVTDTLAAVIMKDPDWSQLPAATPTRVRVLLQRCLQKDPKQRLQAIGDARISLDEVLSGAPEPSSPTVAAATISAPFWRRAMPWVIAAAALLSAAIVLTVAHLGHQSSPEPTTMSQIEPPANTTFGFMPPVLSPDGRQMVFTAAGADGRQQLWLRALDSATAQPIAGTDGAGLPFWSPDGRSIGFFANGKLNRIDLSDGAIVSLADAESGEGGSWAPDGTIVFAPDAGGVLARIPAAGGAAQPIANLPASIKAYSERYPQFLPDGKHFLFFVWSAVPANQGVYAGSLDGGQVRLVLPNYSDALYVRPNHLLFMRQSTLMAAQFDPASLRVSGNPAPLVSKLPSPVFFFHGPFTASGDGDLIYGAGVYKPDSLLWFDRNGKQVGETNPAGYYGYYDTPSISPDGSKLAASIGDAESPTGAIWVFDLRDAVTRPLTFSSAFHVMPQWSPDGKMISFLSNREGGGGQFEKPADGSGSTTLLFSDKALEQTVEFASWTPDGRYLVLERGNASSRHLGIWALPLFGDRKPFPVLQDVSLSSPLISVSPDGKWLAYGSNESGQNAVYAVPFPRGEGKWQVSTNGGAMPRWSRDGKELFYVSPDNHLMAAEISEQGGTFAVQKVESLFPTNMMHSPGWSYDVTGDGTNVKFAVVTNGEQKGPPAWTLVTNWPALLKK